MTARSWARAAGAAVAALGVLTFGAWAGGSLQATGHGRQRRALDAYPAARQRGETRIADALVASGQPMQLSAFSTHDPPVQVIAFYADAFRRLGLLPLSASGPRLGHVSAFDGRDGRQRFATALPLASGETLVLVGTADPRRAPKLLGGAANAPYPVPEQSRAFLGYSSQDGRLRADVGQFVTALPPRDVQAFYRSRLAAQGYRETDPTGAEGLLTFGGPLHDSIAIAIQALDAQRGAAVFVSRIEEGGP